jgi:hypothetical protein
MDAAELWKWHEEFDDSERAGRVERNIIVLRWLEGYDSGFFGGGEEALFALKEARDAYIFGLPLACLFASHVACERMVAGLFASLSDDAVPKDWQRWGLGRLAPEAYRRGWLSQELTSELIALAEQRKVVGHFRRPLDPGTFTSRMASMLPFDHQETMIGLLFTDAGRALRTAFRLAYSPDEGLWRMP